MVKTAVKNCYKSLCLHLSGLDRVLTGSVSSRERSYSPGVGGNAVAFVDLVSDFNNVVEEVEARGRGGVSEERNL